MKNISEWEDYNNARSSNIAPLNFLSDFHSFFQIILFRISNTFLARNGICAGLVHLSRLL